MGISSGFFDSLNGDRKYNVTQLSVLVSSLIKDGVFQNVGTAFSVIPNAGSEVLIGIGYGFFNHRWIQNDSLYPLNMGAAELLLDRIDAVVIEIDNTESVRLGTIKTVKGAPSATPVRPALIKTDFVHQYPLAYILRPANNDNILVGSITQMVGTAECPFVIGVQETLDIDFLFAQWGAQWSAWFQQMKDQLTEDAAGNLQLEIDEINNSIGETDIHLIGDGTITGALSSTFQSVSDGKNTVATTLTNQGVPTQATDTFNIMATNINTVAVNKYNAGFNAGKAEGTVKQMSAFATGEGAPSVSRAVSLTLLANETYFVTVASSGFQERNDLWGSYHNVTFSCPGAAVTPIYGGPYETGSFVVYKVETGTANRTATANATTGGDQGNTSYCSVGLCAAYV